MECPMRVAFQPSHHFRRLVGGVVAENDMDILADRLPERGVARLSSACFPASAGVCSADHVDDADGSIIEGLGDRLKGHVAGSLDRPFVVLLGQ